MTDKQFLTGMWNRVDALAEVERENERARARSRAMQRGAGLKTGLIAAGIIALLCLALCLALQAQVILLLLLAVYIPFCLALFAEGRLFSHDKYQKENHYE